MVARINLKENITPLGHITDEEITLWGRDALLRIPPINSVGDGLLLLVILNPVGDDLSVATSLGITC